MKTDPNVDRAAMSISSDQGDVRIAKEMLHQLSVIVAVSRQFVREQNLTEDRLEMCGCESCQVMLAVIIPLSKMGDRSTFADFNLLN